MKHLNILIVEDHDVVSSSLAQVLHGTSSLNIVETLVTNADEAFEALQKQYFDIVLLDIILKNVQRISRFNGGDELLREINKMNARPKVIILSKIDSLDMLDYIINSLGVDGYILKSRTSLNEVIPALEAVLSDRTFYSNSIEKILRYNEALFDIDLRDRLILIALSEGLTHKAIVGYLKCKDVKMTVSAIEKRIRGLKSRFQSKTSAHLIAKAIREGII